MRSVRARAGSERAMASLDRPVAHNTVVGTNPHRHPHINNLLIGRISTLDLWVATHQDRTDGHCMYSVPAVPSSKLAAFQRFRARACELEHSRSLARAAACLRSVADSNSAGFMRSIRLLSRAGGRERHSLRQFYTRTTPKASSAPRIGNGLRESRKRGN